MCRYSAVDWYRNGERLNVNNTEYEFITESTTEQILKFPITTTGFSEPQHFQCKSGLHCESDSVTVRSYGEISKPDM